HLQRADVQAAPRGPRGRARPRRPRRHPRLVEDRLREIAEAAIGFMPPEEGIALYRVGLRGADVGPLLEIGSYCGKSGVYLGAAAQEKKAVLFTIDHHRGSEENQAGWE